jgi:hypothetical protein
MTRRLDSRHHHRRLLVLYIKLSARTDGSFAITNERNGFTKEYPAARGGRSAAAAAKP